MIVFDLDDTLYKEAEYVDSGIRAVAIEAGKIGIMTEQDAYNLVKNAPDTATGFDLIAAKAFELIPPGNVFDIQRMLAIYRSHIPQLSLTTETADLLENLKNTGINLGLITDGRSITQRGKITALGLEKYMPSKNILISQEIRADKHQPVPFQEMMKRNPAEKGYVYVGDNPEKDFLWPNRLGWQTVMLLDTEGKNIHTQVLAGTDSEQTAHKLISNISELPTVLDSSRY